MAGLRATQFGLQSDNSENVVANAKAALLGGGGKPGMARSTRVALGEITNVAGTTNRMGLRDANANVSIPCTCMLATCVRT